MEFSDWDRRPAGLLEEGAFAVLRPGSTWTPVDAWDVFHTAGLMSEDAWRTRFEPEFGPLDLEAVNALHSAAE